MVGGLFRNGYSVPSSKIIWGLESKAFFINRISTARWRLRNFDISRS